MGIRGRDIVGALRRILPPEQIECSIAYWDQRILPAGEVLVAGLQTFAMPFEGTVVFVDLAPAANWAHPCLFVLVDAATLAASVVEAALPPRGTELSEASVLLRCGKAPAGALRRAAVDSKSHDMDERRSG